MHTNIHTRKELKNMSVQIKITVSDEIYKQLKIDAKRQFRSLSNQASCIIHRHYFPEPEDIITPTPGYPFTPPIVFPGPGIPEEPYKITLSADATQPQPGPDLAPAPEPEVSKYIYKDPGVITFPPEPKYEPVSEEKLEKIQRRLQPYKNTKHTIEDYEQHITDPENKYYKKIKQYCVNSFEDKEFLDILAHPDAAYIKKNYRSIIYAALEIPGTHDLSADEWSEIAGYFKQK